MATNGTTQNNGTVRSSPQNLSLAHRTAIVTGSSRGIGAGIAVLLAARGANVVVNYTSPKSKERADAVVQTIRQSSSESKAVAVQADIVTAEGQQHLIDAALKLSSTGKIDILVHNAGNGDDCYLKDLTEEFYYNQTDLNIKAIVFLTQKTVPHMPRGGRIIIVSSVSARMGVPQQSVYAATKAANEALARVWATELGQSHGITANCVNPGPVATDGYFNSTQEFIDALKPLIDSTPAEARIGQPEDIAPLVGFLASEESRWVTGSVLSASGGLLLY